VIKESDLRLWIVMALKITVELRDVTSDSTMGVRLKRWIKGAEV
jgi:hypothetical protein